MIVAAGVAGKKIALFGLGGSGLATAQSLAAGGAEVIAWDDNPQSVEKAADSGIATQDLRKVQWKDIAALVLSPLDKGR